MTDKAVCCSEIGVVCLQFSVSFTEQCLSQEDGFGKFVAFHIVFDITILYSVCLIFTDRAGLRVGQAR